MDTSILGSLCPESFQAETVALQRDGGGSISVAATELGGIVVFSRSIQCLRSAGMPSLDPANSPRSRGGIGKTGDDSPVARP
jgi:hypothetical protein